MDDLIYYFQRASILLFGFLMGLFSCKESDNNEIILEDTEFKVISLNPENEVDFKNIGKNIEYVVLSTASDYLISEIDKIEVNNQQIFILSKAQKSIFIFDMSGNFLDKIADFGEGPGKYTGISDFFIFKESLYLLTNPSRYIYEYNLDGDLLKIISTNGNYLEEFRISDEGWVSHLNDAYDDENKFNVVLWDSLFVDKKKEFLFLDTDRRNNSLRVDNYISENKEGVFLFQNFSNLIYKFQDTLFLAAFEVLLNDQSIPLEYMKRFKNDSQAALDVAMKENLFTGFKKIIATDKLLFLQAQQGSNIINCFISFDSNKHFAFRNLKSEIEFALVGDIIGVSGQKFVMIVSENVLSKLKELDLEGKINKVNLKNEKIHNVIDLYEKDGNPVLVFFDLDISSMQN
jgi:hypothetical protein